MAQKDKTEAIFPMLEEHWESIRSKLIGPFTTQTFRTLVEEEAPDVWAEMVRRWGPGGMGSGNFYSPANVLYNYLNDKARKQIAVIRLGFVPAAKGWGTRRVMQWELVGGTILPPTQEDIEFVEAKQKYRTHLVRERAPGIRDELLKQRKATGLSCDLCKRTGSEFEESIRNAIFEAHHNTAPVSAGERTTKIGDMALLCACCHRAVHRLVTVRKHWFTLEEAREPLGFERASEKPAG